MNKEWRGNIGSNDQGERESSFMPIIIFIICFIISVFSFYVAQFEWALWFWIVYAWLYGICAVISLIIAIIE